MPLVVTLLWAGAWVSLAVVVAAAAADALRNAAPSIKQFGASGGRIQLAPSLHLLHASSGPWQATGKGLGGSKNSKGKIKGIIVKAVTVNLQAPTAQRLNPPTLALKPGAGCAKDYDAKRTGQGRNG